MNLSVEQRTRIRETVFARSDVPRVTSVNFSVSVGTVVPSRVRIATVPAEIIEIYPEFRGHSYLVVRDEIVIVDNRRRIVAVIPGDRAGVGRGSGSRTDVVIDLSPEEIRQVQLVLVEQGFSVEVDGRLGPRTRQALIQFQRRHGLSATGRIDRSTVTKLGVNIRSGDQPSRANERSGGDRQPATTGQGGAKGSGASQPANQNQQQGTGSQGRQSNEPSAMPKSGQSSGQGSGQSSGQGSGQSGTTGQGASPSTGQGGSQPPAANQGSGAGQGQGGSPAAKPEPKARSGAGSGDSAPPAGSGGSGSSPR